jgi:hypothetical protein
MDGWMDECVNVDNADNVDNVDNVDNILSLKCL